MAEKLYKLSVDCATGEQTRVEFTAEEYAQHALDVAAYEERAAAELAIKNALAALKASAKAKLIAGTPLTAEEADTLVI